MSANLETLETQILTKASDYDKNELRRMLDQLIEETKKSGEQSRKKLGNPAVIGLASFAITATLFQFHNFGWVSKNPVMCLGVILGGITQLFAGLLEFANGNCFGMAVFSGYGAFWISLIAIMVLNDYTRYTVNDQDMAFFNLCFLIFTIILFVASLRHSLILGFIFFTLTAGIFFLMLDHFFVTIKELKTTGAIFLLINSMAAYYFLATILLQEAYKRPILPIGAPLHECLAKLRRDRNCTFYSDTCNYNL